LLAGALLLGALHVPWHAPLIGTDFSLTEFVPLGVAIVAFSVFTAVLWTRAEGSMLLPALAHVAVNTAGGPTLFQMFGAADRLGLYWAWALLWVVASAAAWLLAAPARLLAPSPALEAT
jgi:hypothetical protein